VNTITGNSHCWLLQCEATDNNGRHLTCVLQIFLVLLATLMAAFSPAWGEEIPEPPWGIMAPLEMGRDFLVDNPSAAAAVVFDRGDIIVGPGFTFTLQRRCRRQIFSPAGYRYATTKIPYQRGERIINLEAHTITPEGRRVKVPKNRIYKINNGRWRALVFAFPEVTPGCVVEYRYELQSRDFYYLRPWIFQTDIPTEYSQLVVHLPPGFEYAAVVNGYDRIRSPTIDSYYSPEHQNTKVKTFSWSAEHLPPLRSPGFLPSLEDYRSRLDFQIVRYRTRHTERKFIDSWPDLIERVRTWYDDLLRLPPEFRQQAARLASGIYDTRSYAERVYRFCRDSIAFATGGRTVSAENLRSAAEVLEGRRGNAVEKNLLLIALMRWAGLAADPVLISTLDHLCFDPRDHRLDQFNHVIARWDLPGEPVFLDASDPAAWFGLLPPTAAVDHGVWVGPDSGAVIEIPSVNLDHTAKLDVELWLDPDGNAVGRMQGNLAGFRAWEWARKRAPGDFEEFVKTTWLSPTADIRVLRVTVPERVENGTIDFTMDFVWEDVAMAGSGRLYFRPAGLFGLAENPFIDPRRRFPVSFAFPFKDVANIVWHLPEGYTVAEIPCGGGKHTDFLNFSCGFSATENTMTARRRLSVERRDFPRSAYGELQNFFECVVEVDRDLAVGVRTASATSASYTR